MQLQGYRLPYGMEILLVDGRIHLVWIQHAVFAGGGGRFRCRRFSGGEGGQILSGLRIGIQCRHC